MNWTKCTDEMPESLTPVLVACVVEDTRHRILRAYYCGHKEHCISNEMPETDWEYYDEEEDEFYQPAGWYEFNEHDETHWYINGDVTHWMPLPAFPELSKEVKEK